MAVLVMCLLPNAGSLGLAVGAAMIFGLVALMFLGRVGGLTLIYAAQSVRRTSCSTLPLEKVTVG